MLVAEAGSAEGLRGVTPLFWEPPQQGPASKTLLTQTTLKQH